MFALTTGVRIFLAVEPVDMRKQFNGLWAVAAQHLGEDPRQGAWFAFTNKTRDRLKLLYWDGTGVWCWQSGWSGAASPGRSAATPGSWH